MSTSAAKPEVEPNPDLTMKEAAAFLGVSPRSVRRLVERREVEAYKILDCVFVRQPSLARYLERCRATPLQVLPAAPGVRPTGRPKTKAAAASAG